MDPRSPARILIVDDELPTLEVHAALDDAPWLRDDHGSRGDSALRSIGTVHPDLVLLDVNMPGLDGVEVCRRSKGDVTTRLIPVVLVTTLAASEDRVRGIGAGADDFVSKPPIATELQARVRSLIRLKHYTDELDSVDSVISIELLGKEVLPRVHEGLKKASFS